MTSPLSEVTYSELERLQTSSWSELLGMKQTLLTATNVITVHALPGIPNLIRIAEKSKGGLEAVGEVDAARGMIEGMITIAGEECPFVLSKVE